MDRTQPCGGCDVGSIPAESTCEASALEHANLFACVRESNAGAMSRKLARPRGGAQTNFRDGESLVAGDDRREHEVSEANECSRQRKGSGNLLVSRVGRNGKIEGFPKAEEHPHKNHRESVRRNYPAIARIRFAIRALMRAAAFAFMTPCFAALSIAP